jgi:HKD family nuclease
VAVVLYTNKSAFVARPVASVSVVSRWAQALLASSALTKAALLAESVLKVIRKQLKSCFLKLLLVVMFKTRASKALLHLSLLSLSQKTIYCLY